MHSSQGPQVKDLEVKQTTLQNQEIAKLKKSRDDLLQKVQDSFKKAQSMCIAPPSYIAQNYCQQRSSIHRHFITRRIPLLNHCIEGESSTNLENQLDLRNQEYFFNQRIYLLESSAQEVRALFNGEEELEYFKSMEKKHRKIIGLIKSDLLSCLEKVGESIKKSKERDGLYNRGQMYRVNEIDSDESDDESEDYEISDLEFKQWELYLAQELYSRQGIWGHHPQASVAHGKIFEKEHKIATPSGLKRSKHTRVFGKNDYRTGGLDCLSSLEDDFVEWLQNNFKHLEGLEKGQEYTQDLETQIKILKSAHATHETFQQGIYDKLKNFGKYGYGPEPDIYTWEFVHNRSNDQLSAFLYIIELRLVEKIPSYKGDERKAWQSIVSLNPFLAQEIPDFDRPPEANQEYYTQKLLVLSIEKTRALLSEPVIIYDTSSRAYSDCLNSLRSIAASANYPPRSYLKYRYCFDSLFIIFSHYPQVQSTLSSVDSIITPLHLRHQENISRTCLDPNCSHPFGRPKLREHEQATLSSVDSIAPLHRRYQDYCTQAPELQKEHAQLILSSVDSIAAPLQDIAPEQVERR